MNSSPRPSLPTLTGRIYAQRPLLELRVQRFQTGIQNRTPFSAFTPSSSVYDPIPVCKACLSVRPISLRSPSAAELFRKSANGSSFQVRYASLRLAVPSRRPSGLRKTKSRVNSLAHRTTWLRSDLSARLASRYARFPFAPRQQQNCLESLLTDHRSRSATPL